MSDTEKYQNPDVQRALAFLINGGEEPPEEPKPETKRMPWALKGGAVLAGGLATAAVVFYGPGRIADKVTGEHPVDHPDRSKTYTTPPVLGPLKQSSQPPRTPKYASGQKGHKPASPSSAKPETVTHYRPPAPIEQIPRNAQVAQSLRPKKSKADNSPRPKSLKTVPKPKPNTGGASPDVEAATRAGGVSPYPDYKN